VFENDLERSQQAFPLERIGDCLLLVKV